MTTTYALKMKIWMCFKKQLQDDSNIAVGWFNNNQTTANPDKFQSIILSRDRVDQFDISLDGQVISRGNSLKMLGVTLDDNLNFNDHVRNICQTASCQINALKRISNFLNEQCRMNVYKSFISANFNYCPIVWLFCGKTNLNKLEKLHERALATVFCDNSLTYEDILEKEWSATHPTQSYTRCCHWYVQMHEWFKSFVYQWNVYW